MGTREHNPRRFQAMVRRATRNMTGRDWDLVKTALAMMLNFQQECGEWETANEDGGPVSPAPTEEEIIALLEQLPGRDMTRIEED